MNETVYEYDTVILPSDIGKGGAYVPFPDDIVRVTIKERE